MVIVSVGGDDGSGDPGYAGDPATAQIHRQRYTPYGAVRGYPDQLGVERGWLGQYAALVGPIQKGAVLRRPAS